MRTNTHTLLIASLAIIVTLSCKKNENTVLDVSTSTTSVCGTKDPLNDLKWLSDKVNLLTGGPKINGVVLFEYKNEVIIEIQCSVCSSTNLHQYYCDGTKIDFASSSDKVKEYKDYVANRKEVKVLYGVKIWN